MFRVSVHRELAVGGGHLKSRSTGQRQVDLKLVWSAQKVPGQPGLLGWILSQKSGGGDGEAGKLAQQLRALAILPESPKFCSQPSVTLASGDQAPPIS